MNTPSLPRYTPYDGSDPLFRIGLKPLDLNDWIEVDDQLVGYLDEKKRLATLYGDKVFAEEPDTGETQREALDLLVHHLAENHADTHRFEAGKCEVAGRTVDLASDQPPLWIAAQLVQEDLILMRRGEAGWRLAAASLSFPSSWSLREKFSRPLHDIHETVPGFQEGTRNARLIERIFDNLPVAIPVRRFNWSVYSDDELFHDDKTAEHLNRGSFADGIYLRVEHQTLRRLPISGDILFTVRIHIDPFEILNTHPHRQEICAGFVRSLKALSAEELDYKGLSEEAGGLIERLEGIGEGIGERVAS